jgi:hypothetical protein
MAASTTRTVKAKFDGDAKGMIAAAKEGEHAIDSFDKSTRTKFKKSGEESSKGFVRSIKKWFGGAGGLQEIGQSGGTVFGSGFLGALKTPVLGPAIAGALLAAVLTVAPAAGAVLAGGMVTAFGAGLAGLGIVFAAKSKVVQDKWKATLQQLGADMTLLSKPFESVLVRIADDFEGTVDRFNPYLARAFTKMAAPIERFVDEGSDALEELIPAIAPVTEAFNKVLDSLGPAMKTALADVAAGITDVAESVQRNPEALADVVRGVGDLTKSGLRLITTLNDVNGKFEDLTGGVSLVDVTMKGLQFTLAPLQGLFTATGKGIDLLNAALHGTEASGQSLSDAANSTVKLAQGYKAVGDAQKGTIASTDTLAAKITRQKAATDALIASTFQLQAVNLGMSGAQIAYQAALDATTESIKTNGKTLDINTEKGRSNREALNNLAQSANQQTQAMIESGKGTVAAARSAETSRANFIRLATQMGLGSKAAAKLADDLIGIPNVTRTAKLQANKRDLEQKLAAAKRELADPNLTKTRKAELTAEIARLRAGIAEAERLLAGLPSSKTVTIKTIRQTVETVIRPDVGVRAPGRASGGLTQPGRTYLVGERGPELWSETRGGRMLSAEQTTAALAGEQQMVAEIHIEIGGEVVRVVRTEIKADKRQTKRAVKAA